MAVPTAANPGQQASAPGKDLAYTTGRTPSSTSKRNKFVLPVPDRQGMKFVHSYLRNNDDILHVVARHSEEPFAIIDSVLSRYGLPIELRYLAVIESELKPSARSRVGARGPWQLMPHTAHVLGLTVNRNADDRTNFYKSTSAAAKYLKDLHREFGDWLLVLAAYNGGPSPVYRAIRKAHSRSFWAIQKYLPAESRQHVKKFIATAYYFEAINYPGTKPATTPVRTVSAPAPGYNPAPAGESDNERFSRLMQESAQSLKASNELLTVAN